MKIYFMLKLQKNVVAILTLHQMVILQSDLFQGQNIVSNNPVHPSSTFMILPDFLGFMSYCGMLDKNVVYHLTLTCIHDLCSPVG